MNITIDQIDTIRESAERARATGLGTCYLDAPTTVALCDAAAKGIAGMEASVIIVNALREQLDARDAEIRRLKAEAT